MASGVGGFPQPVQPPRDQRTDQLSCFPQRHGPPGRVTLQTGMTGQVAADLPPIAEAVNVLIWSLVTQPRW
jgi:hypothetical protein